MLRLKSPAKINLGLKLIRKREDNFHDIATIFQMIDLHDEVELVEREKGISVITDHPQVPDGKENLAFKAAELFLDRFNIEKGIEIRIQKNIPVAAGLGGGSSNAASVLMGLNSLWKTGASRENLISIGEQIGSDVPFFIFATAAFGEGRGERLKKITLLGKYSILLVNPRIEISTAWAYRNARISLTKSVKGNIMSNFNPAVHIRDILPSLENDLESGVLRRYRVIADIKGWLSECGAEASCMSGSGSTVFGIFLSEKRAFDTCQKATDLGWDCFLTKPTTSYPLSDDLS